MRIHEAIAQAAGTTAQLVHVPSDTIAMFDPEWGASLLGDKMHSMIFDNTKIKRAVPEYQATISFDRGVEEIIAWYDADPARQEVDADVDQLMDRILTFWESVHPSL